FGGHGGFGGDGGFGGRGGGDWTGTDMPSGGFGADKPDGEPPLMPEGEPPEMPEGEPPEMPGGDRQPPDGASLPDGAESPRRAA
ncbi:MAG: hypothetical protein K2O14_09980, partial [Oscillospiraceae bacterium]|nr:hypothetical protein [Oscillospiraceae bacterium]